MEHSQEAALQAELSLVQAEEAALPLKISKLQEALQLEHADLQRREECKSNLYCAACTCLTCQIFICMNGFLLCSHKTGGSNKAEVIGQLET